MHHFAASNQCNRPDPLENMHDDQTEVSVCAVVGGFRSSAFVSFFAFAVCLFSVAVRLKAMRNAIINGRKSKKANTIERNRQE